MTRGLHLLKHALAAAVTVGAVSSDAAAARHRHAFQCRFAQRNTIAATREARVYVGHGPRVGTAVFGCLYGSSRRRLLGSTGGEIGVTHVQLAGRYVGFFVQTSGARDSTMADAGVYVVDLKSGKRLHGENGGGMGQVDLFGFNIVLKADGAAGWIVETRDPSTNRLVGREVHRVDTSGAAVLDSSICIDETSLALGGSSLYWTDAGQVRSAHLR